MTIEIIVNSKPTTEITCPSLPSRLSWGVVPTPLGTDNNAIYEQFHTKSSNMYDITTQGQMSGMSIISKNLYRITTKVRQDKEEQSLYIFNREESQFQP